MNVCAPATRDNEIVSTLTIVDSSWKGLFWRVLNARATVVAGLAKIWEE